MKYLKIVIAVLLASSLPATTVAQDYASFDPVRSADVTVGISLNVPLGGQRNENSSRPYVSLDLQRRSNERGSYDQRAETSRPFIRQPHEGIRLSLQNSPRLYVDGRHLATFGEGGLEGYSDNARSNLDSWEITGVVVGGLLLVGVGLALAAGFGCVVTDEKCEDE